MADFEQIIYQRRSTRKFKTTPIEPEKIEKLKKAVLLAPSGRRIYPSEYIFVDDREILRKISKAKQTGAAFVADAALAVVVVADTLKYDIWVEDASISACYIMLEAENLGLGCCWVQMRLRETRDGKSATENLREIFGLEDNHEILSVMTMGYKDESKPSKKDSELLYNKVHYNKLGNEMK